MNILVFNQQWFVDHWRAAGHRVVTCGHRNDMDVRLPAALMHIDSALKCLPDGFVPDVALFHDNSAPPLVSGLDETRLPLAFLSVDTHHHVGLHRHLSHVFDLMVVAQKDYLSQFREVEAEAVWMPLWATRAIEPSTEKTFGAAFVGNMNAQLNPGRVKFFEELRAKVPVHCETGEFWRIFPKAEIVINQTVKGDFNFRVCEAMMSGSMLLTERSGNGLTDLFEDGRHLVTYTKGDVDEAAKHIEYYTSHPDEARRIGAAGRAEVLAKHTEAHRADTMLTLLQGLKKKDSPRKFFASMMASHILSGHMERHDGNLMIKALAEALESATRGLQAGEVMTNESACHLVIACLRYDRFVRSGAGQRVLTMVAEGYSSNVILQLAYLREMLNLGDREKAASIAKAISPGPLEDTFSEAERAIQGLWSDFSQLVPPGI